MKNFSTHVALFMSWPSEAEGTVVKCPNRFLVMYSYELTWHSDHKFLNSPKYLSLHHYEPCGHQVRILYARWFHFWMPDNILFDWISWSICVRLFWFKNICLCVINNVSYLCCFAWHWTLSGYFVTPHLHRCSSRLLIPHFPPPQRSLLSVLR